MEEYLVSFNSPLWKRLRGFDGSQGTAAAEVLARMMKDEGDALQEDLYRLGMAILQGTGVNTLTAVTFPHLAAQAMIHRGAYDRLSIMNLLSVLKPLMLGVDVFGMGERIYRGYWESVYQLMLMTERYLEPVACAELEGANRPFLARLYFLLVCQAADTVPFLLYSPFEAAFHIKCPVCGCDLYSMHVTPDATGAIPDITSCADEAAGGAVYRWFANVLRQMGETHYAGLLPYLYGQSVCPVCGAPSQVMASALAYVEAEICPPASHTPEEIQWLADYGQRAAEDGKKAAFYRDLARNFSRRP